MIRYGYGFKMAVVHGEIAADDIYVGGVRFKRTVLPSATAPSPQPIEAEADQLFDEWEAE